MEVTTEMIPDKRLLAATLIMDILLDGRCDRFGRPLSDHCVRVMEACRAQGSTEDQCIAAVLHDCVEENSDRPMLILSTVDLLFGFEVSRMVDYLTRRPNTPYDQYIHALADLPSTIPIKLADLADNLDPSRVDPATGEGIPLSLRRRYERARDYLLSHLRLTSHESVLDKAQEG